MQSSDNGFHGLYQSIVQIFQDCIPSKCSLQLFKVNEACEDNCGNRMEITSINDDTINDISKTKKPVLANVYKYRSSRKERHFVPPATNAPDRPDNNSQISQVSSDEFIAVTSDNSDFINDKNFINILKSKRYVNIHKEKHRSESVKKLTCNKSILIDSNTESRKQNARTETSRKRKSDNVTYLSLKVKRIQANNNRIKATKLAKKTKK